MIAGILLAAGGARRFHSQKLLAPLDGEPVVCHAARALAAATDVVVAVVGHEGERVGQALAERNLRVVDNAEWERGLASSLRVGVGALGDDVEAAVVALGDQPRIDPAVIDAVIAAWRDTGRPIVSASYRGTRAHPVLFARSVFGELAELDGDAGARLLIERSAERVVYVEVDAEVPRDVDTPEDLDALKGAAGG